jgi:phage terminase large subunit
MGQAQARKEVVEREAFANFLTAYSIDALAFVREVIGVEPSQWQADALAALSTDNKIAIRSGHGVGKSAFLSWVIIWWLLTHHPAKVACTAPTGHQLDDVLWGELGIWIRKLPDGLRDRFNLKDARCELVEAPKFSYAVARTARREQPEALQGFHSPNMLFIVDEASGVDDIIFQVGEGAMSQPGAKTIMTGNPTRVSGYFYDAFHKMRHRWKTFRVNAEEVAVERPELVDVGHIEDMALKYGSLSSVYSVRVLGDFPKSEDDVVIPLWLLEAAKVRDIQRIEAGVVWGLDVARFGDARTALCKRTRNSTLESIQFWRGKDLMQVAGMIMRQYEDARLKPDAILVDVIGVGGGVVDRLEEMGAPVRGVNVAESSAVAENYMRLRDELWWRAREWLEELDCVMVDDEELMAELCSVKYAYTSTGKIKVESKEDMKRRGLRSCDLADAFVLTFADSSIHSGWYGELPYEAPPIV